MILLNSPTYNNKYLVVDGGVSNIDDILVKCKVSKKLCDIGKRHIIDLTDKMDDNNGESINIKGKINLSELQIACFKFVKMNIYVGRTEDRNKVLGSGIIKDSSICKIKIKNISNRHPDLNRFALQCGKIHYSVDDLNEREIFKPIGMYLLICDAPTWTIYGNENSDNGIFLRRDNLEERENCLTETLN
ncbi:MAG: hypothetical protein LBT59_27785 [Clostridiales bacterium]|jgi:hypothetical protein|nr:hypothetical protein [Clostridiales bacterium]